MDHHGSPKILEIDIETAPHTAHVWGLFKQNIAINQIMETGRVLCFAYRWRTFDARGKEHVSPIKFASELGGVPEMLMHAHSILDEADVVVTYNGKKFDIPTLNKEFLQHGILPPSPYKQVDLYRVAKSRFRFASNKMDHLARCLGIKTKLRHQGHDLWVRCMEGDPKAWQKMERYNKRDVLILGKIYKRMLPWISNHPNMALYSPASRPTCTNCMSTKTHSRGVALTRSGKYTRYVCTSCGTWLRSRFQDTTGTSTTVLKNTNILTQEVS